MTVKEYVHQTLQTMNDADLKEVAEYLAFLRFRARAHSVPPFDPAQAASLYAESAAEDRDLAEEGMGEYACGLATEDSQ
jgi:hypothetical protein